jgi:replication-associated recombination protein RarA
MDLPTLFPNDPMQLRTQRGYNFSEVSSAMQKAIRRSDAALAGYWALELWQSGFLQ